MSGAGSLIGLSGRLEFSTFLDVRFLSATTSIFGVKHMMNRSSRIEHSEQPQSLHHHRWSRVLNVARDIIVICLENISNGQEARNLWSTPVQVLTPPTKLQTTTEMHGSPLPTSQIDRYGIQIEIPNSPSPHNKY